MTTKTGKLVIAVNVGLAFCTANALASNAPNLLLPGGSSTFGESRSVSDEYSTGEAKDKAGIKTKEIKNKDTKIKDTTTKETDTKKDSKIQGDLVALDEAFLLFLAELEDVDGDLLHPVDVNTELERSLKTKTQPSTDLIEKVNENKQSDSGNQIGKEPPSKSEVKGNTASAKSQAPKR